MVKAATASTRPSIRLKSHAVRTVHALAFTIDLVMVDISTYAPKVPRIPVALRALMLKVVIQNTKI